ncbi:MAG: hypothetical protein H6825_01395 [Planctomycetes bacterium]|nr:hypothetical protein [Planctomycetota bacterium]
MTASLPPRGALATALLSLGLLASCGDPGPYGYGHSDEQPAQTAKAAVSPKGVIRGVIDWPGAQPPSGFVCVYLTGRSTPDARLPELVQRLPPGPFPMMFEVSARDLTLPGTLAGDWTLEARLDKDGVLLAQAGDIAGRSKSAVHAGDDGVVLELRETVAHDDDPALLRDLQTLAGPALASPQPGGSSSLPPGHPPIDSSRPAAMPGGMPTAKVASAPSAAAQQPPKMPGPRFTGTIEVDPKIASAARGGVLYVMIKQGAEARGMPRAAYKVVDPVFPLTFDIGPEHVPLQVDNKADMLQGTLYISARVDMDGDVMTKKAGDLEMTAPPVAATAGGDPVTIVLDEVRSS